MYLAIWAMGQAGLSLAQNSQGSGSPLSNSQGQGNSKKRKNVTVFDERLLRRLGTGRFVAITLQH